MTGLKVAHGGCGKQCAWWLWGILKLPLPPSTRPARRRGVQGPYGCDCVCEAARNLLGTTSQACGKLCRPYGESMMARHHIVHLCCSACVCRSAASCIFRRQSHRRSGLLQDSRSRQQYAAPYMCVFAIRARCRLCFQCGCMWPLLCAHATEKVQQGYNTARLAQRGWLVTTGLQIYLHAKLFRQGGDSSTSSRVDLLQYPCPATAQLP